MKKILLGFFLSGIIISNLMADAYTRGFLFYGRYIYKYSHMPAYTFVKKLHIKNKKDLERLIKNPKLFIEVAKEAEMDDKVIKGINKILKSKYKTKYFKSFLEGIIRGRIPAYCGG